MNNLEAPADPFEIDSETEQDNRHNSGALVHLRREICMDVFDEEARRVELKEQNGQRKSDAPVIDIPERLARDRAEAASCKWSALDLLAMRRCAILIAQADSFGLGVTATELAGISSRKSSEVSRTSRQINRRLSEIVATPDTDAIALFRAEALDGILPPIHEAV
ncbi:hypothetical protein [Leisingera sp. McT4-56]|uniref:hypothetical protein n=1 Tax=Leisingera sp. McT4-56 TaxID=2881255 RepID=UPI001CF90069|nr:hypothetical protein [Leisingera sp. McT4-56]MCB4456878.1 hypothetical protein [Leisingera sp. McT4-56]